MKKIFLAFVCLVFSASGAEARYVDYPGSWTVMQMNDEALNALHAHYTVKPYYSVGYALEYWREDEWILNAGQMAWLLHRWNLLDAQANLYARGGAGVAVSDFEDFDDETEFAGYGGIAFDAENRRFYMSYENSYMQAGDIFEGFEQKARVGFAPYVAEYGSLHTWIILQVDHKPWSEGELTWTPMLRFFKGDVLTEIGVSDKGDVLFNLMLRF